MRVSVVVATKDRPTQLREALEAIAMAVRAHDEVIVVDSGSDDPRVRDVVEEAGVAYVRCEIPGASLARNRGVEAATGEIVAFTDDDCRPRPGWTAAIADAFARDASLGFVTGGVDGDQISTERMEGGVWDRPLDPMHLGHGANWACRRDVFRSVGGFDEVMGPGAPLRAAEDHDLFWRLLLAGARGTHVPGAAVGHPAWRSFGELVRTEWAYGIGSGALAAKATAAGLPGPRVRVRAWEEGVVRAAEALARGWKRPAIRHGVRALGTIAGARRARRRLIRSDLRFSP